MARDPAPTPTPAAAPQPFFLQGIGQRRDSFFTNYESLWAKLWGLEATLAQVEAEPPQQDAAKGAVLRQCKENLREARDCLERHKAALLMRPTSPHLFWRLAHLIDEELLLVMPKHMLAVVAPAVQEVFCRNIPDKPLRERWLGKDELTGPLPQSVKRLTAQGPDSTEALDRNVLKDALSAVNERTDRQFRQIATNTLVQVLSSVLLLLLLIALGILGSLRFGFFAGKDPEDLSVAGQLLPLLMLVGAMGAILSNMMTRESFDAPAGQAGRFFLLYLLGKPVLGAAAALFLFFVVGSGWLFDIHSSQSGSPSPDRPLQLTVGSDAAVYFTHFLLTFVAGFAAERLLRGFIDKAIKMLLQQAEKSEVSKPPSTLEKA